MLKCMRPFLLHSILHFLLSMSLLPLPCLVQIVLSVQLFALLAYNVAGMMVTGHLGAVFRTVLETMRTLFVWLLGLLLFYTSLGGGELGESWSRWSYLQAAG
eukprot:GHRR01031185.1.p1 GENE.GHRR01031185.1~~GHRR01031185.1.p1  ORF type:complete len:102 (+),score=20.72 GHRR01031185.1:84-389(+)